MRKFILAIVALFFSAGAQAHVSAVPFPEVGSSQDAHEAAFFIGQTYLPPAAPQITCNIVTGVASVGGPCASPAATCSGYATKVNRVATFNSGSPNISVTVDTFLPGDVGKYVIMPNANFGNNYRTIQTVTDPQHIVLNGNAFATGAGVASDITYGFDDSPSFKAFNTWARANQGSTNQVVLTAPAGSTCWFGSQQTISGVAFTGPNNYYFAGINNLVVDGSSTSTIFTNINGSGFFLAGAGVTNVSLTNASGLSARLKSVSASSSTIELTAASYAAGYISRFSATPGALGNWIMISGMDIQTGFNEDYGSPPNHQYFEWRQIISICNNTGPCTGTATMTLDRPLTSSYLDTWPMWSDGTTGGIDQGGPATAYALGAWNTTVEWRNITIEQGQSLAWGRNVTFRNVVWLGNSGTVPSQNESFTAINTTYSGGTGWEVDKLVGTLTMDNATFTRIDFQSSSVNSLVMTNSNITSMFGTPRDTTITDTTIGTFRPGAWTNGASTGPLVCTRCNVTTFQWADQGLVQTYGAAYSKSASLITTANANNTGANGPPHRIFVPGGNIFYRMASSLGTIGLYQGGAQTQDATNSYVVSSDAAAAFPTYAGYASQMVTHPATQFTCDGCTGQESFVATNTQAGCPALGPLGECSSWQNVTFPAPFTIRGNMQVRGKISTLTIDVKTAATAAGSVGIYAVGQFGLTTVKQSTWTSFVWNVQINAKQTGKRVYTYGVGWTCNGVTGPGTGGTCAGDSPGTDPPEQVWIGAGLDFGTTTTFSTSPIIDISATTNQGVVP